MVELCPQVPPFPYVLTVGVIVARLGLNSWTQVIPEKVRLLAQVTVAQFTQAVDPARCLLSKGQVAQTQCPTEGAKSSESLFVLSALGNLHSDLSRLRHRLPLQLCGRRGGSRRGMSSLVTPYCSDDHLHFGGGQKAFLMTPRKDGVGWGPSKQDP